MIVCVFALLLCLLPQADRPTFDEPEPVARVRCSEIEINTTYYWDETKQELRPKFHQVIGWKRYHDPQIVGNEDNWRVYNAGWHVVAYHLIVPDSRRVRYRSPFVYVRARLQHSGCQWVEYVGLRKRRTHTLNDPEMDDRQWWPLELRDKQ